MSFRRKIARKGKSHIAQTARPFGNRDERRNRYCHKPRPAKYKASSVVVSQKACHYRSDFAI